MRLLKVKDKSIEKQFFGVKSFQISMQNCLECFGKSFDSLTCDWTTILFDYLYKQDTGSCVWQFKNAKLAQKNSFFTFEAYCNECNSQIQVESAKNVKNDGLLCHSKLFFSKKPCLTNVGKRRLSGKVRKNLGLKMLAEKSKAKSIRLLLAKDLF